MRILTIFFLVGFLAIQSCKSKKETDKQEPQTEYKLFGTKLSENQAVSKEEIYKSYNTLKIGDTLNVKFTSTINEVCSKKGCWMKLPLTENEKVMVRFKDYGFFMPLDSQGKEVIVEGKAFVKVTSVDELRHYAEDAGKSKEEIEKITEPKKEMAFLAHGVLL